MINFRENLAEGIKQMYMHFQNQNIAFNGMFGVWHESTHAQT